MSEPTVQTEVLRLQTLQALGIAVYHPRFRLPGAKASEQGPWVSVDAARADSARVAVSETAQQRAPLRVETVTAESPVAVPVTRAASVATSSLDVTSTAIASAQTTSAPALARTAPPPAATPAPRATDAAQAIVQNFQLLFLQVDDELAIVNQIPALARPQLQDKQLALLTNLLRWLGKAVPGQTPRMFRWPLPGLEHMVASTSAQTSLLHFLEQAHSERGFRYLLQLGPQAVAPDTGAWQAFATHSLDEMLALPALKREVWQTLLPLHGLLHTR